MKKDIEWLKEKIKQQDIVMEKGYIRTSFLMSLIEKLDKPEVTLNRAFEKVAESYPITKEEVWRHLELLEAYDGKVIYGEPEILSKEWINNNSINASHDGVTDEYVHVDDLKNLLVPKQEEITEEQAWEVIEDKYDFSILQNVIGYVEKEGYTVLEKPTIPQFVVDWIEEVKDKERTLYGAMSECPREVDYWLIDGDCSNQDTFARAWLDGYTVEKEQKYYARIKGWELFADFVGVQYWGIVSIYGRLGFVSADDAKDKTKDEWKRLDIDDSNAEFVEVV